MDAFQDIEDEIEAEQIAFDDAAAECEARVIFVEEGAQVEAPDVFRNAMLDLLKNVPATVNDAIVHDGYDSNYDD